MQRIVEAPANSGEVVLGRTIPSLLDEAVERRPNPRALNQRAPGGWDALSNEAFQARSRRIAHGLRDEGLTAGSRVALLAHSDVGFCVADMACLMAGLVNVPIHTTHTPANMGHILRDSGSEALIVADAGLFHKVKGELAGLDALERVIFIEDVDADVRADDALSGRDVILFEELEQRGRTVAGDDPERLADLEADLSADELATLMYTSGTTGEPKGVMLTHENLTSNVIAAITGLETYQEGPDEVSMSFLPLSHIFQRNLQYGAMWYGTSVYFSDPETLSEDFQSVKPTFFASVPRVLEKAYERIKARGEELTGMRRVLFDWSMGLAERHEVGEAPSSLEAFQLGIADRLVFSKWRDALGGNIRTVIVGGAALRPELVNRFGAAGLDVLQGYGLTETSPVIAFNRPDRNQPGTVGPVVAGTEAAIADDGEILARGPHIMKGYWERPETTADVLDDDGWFATGDLGDVTEEGYLVVTGRKKDLFKLSTGKYVTPQALEQALEGTGLIDHALVVGEGEKYCAAVVFVDHTTLGEIVDRDPDAIDADVLASEDIQNRYRSTVVAAQRDLPTWSQAKRMALVLTELTRDEGMLTPKLSMQRPRVRQEFDDVVQALYDRYDGELENAVVLDLRDHAA